MVIDRKKYKNTSLWEIKRIIKQQTQKNNEKVQNTIQKEIQEKKHKKS